MGRPAKVSSDDIVAFITENIQLFAHGIPKSSHRIWVDFSERVVHWQPKTAYNHVLQDRNNDLTKARNLCNIDVPVVVPTPIFRDDSDLDSDSSFTILDPNDSSFLHNDVFHPSPDHSLFTYNLKKSDWDQIKPQPIKSGKLTLKKKCWTNILLESFWNRYKLPCAFLVDHHYVSESPFRQFFIKIEGHCGDTEICQNTFVAIIKDDPGENSPTIDFYTRNTRFDDHKTVKRPCNGDARKLIGKDLQGKCVEPWRRKKAREMMSEDDILEPPHLPNPDVLRHAKKEELDGELGIDSSRKGSTFNAIAEMRHKEQFNKILRNIGLPFYCFYSTPLQLTLFQEYCRLEKNSEICLDATGSLVKEIVEPGGIKSKHIFLYAVTINSQNRTYPVYLALSTQHNNFFIAMWLKYWVGILNAPIPKRTVSDYGRALLLALCETYNGMHLDDYNDLCLKWLLKKKENPSLALPQRINTLIKVDVAHVIHFVTRWKCLSKDTRGKSLKRFFVHAISLMIDCNCVAMFEELYLLTCIVALHEFSDSTIDISSLPEIHTVADAIVKLEEYIGNREVFCLLIEELGDSVKPADEQPEVHDFKLEDESAIKKWIKELRLSAGKVVNKGKIRNGYWLPEFITSMKTMANEFPLWTGVMTSSETKHASSAYGEGYFSYLKNMLLQSYTLPMSAEKFLKIHIADCKGCDAIMGSKIQQFIFEKRKEIPTSHKMLGNSNCTVLNLNKKNDTKIIKPQNESLSMLSSLDSSMPYTIKTGEVAYEQWKGRVNDNINGFGLNMNNNSEADVSLQLQDYDGPKEFCTESPIGHSSLMNDEAFNFGNNHDSATNNFPLQSVVSLDHSYSHTDSQASSNISVTTSPKIHTPKKKYTIKKVEKSPSFHFRPCPEINLMTRSNHRNMNRKKQLVLANGNILESVHINNMFLFLKNTCGFDSLVQILYCAALDDIQYWNYISNSSVKILKFVKLFSLSTNSDQSERKNYLERAKILMEYFDLEKVEYPEPSRIYTLDAFSSIINHWINLFPSDPSAFIEYDCSNTMCKRPSKTLNFVDIQWEKVRNRKTNKLDFNNLQDAVILTSHLQGKVCGYENCKGIITNEKVIGNRQVAIDVDVRDPTDNNRSLPCSLQDFPKFLELDTKYRLAGIVHYQDSHFVAYCRRMTSWRKFNSVPVESINVPGKTEIIPNVAIYIKI